MALHCKALDGSGAMKEAENDHSSLALAAIIA
jgi:hypothetical protein